MNIKDKTENETNSNAPKDALPNEAIAQSLRIDSPKAANLKVYEWATQWGLKPRQIIESARRLNIRVQNRLTRLAPADAKRVLAEIQNPTPDSETT